VEIGETNVGSIAGETALIEIIAEMFYLWHPRRSVCPVQQDFLFFGVPCNVCSQGEIFDANEKHSWS
jgi:hypothetical protein